ncbi:hypothetical protein EHI46_24190 [Rhizobium leguminosarum]|uniref:hypothetical protein n=1 Tax=Rhizobium leguminosarum TaxID=384 RepID=UPI000FF01DFB|nr:hypothetical protein [Rhizobium leguminosarum]RWY68525.1 hypothetical protein EHI46_24190 [Rhizobium leguminosarum]
MSDAQLRLSLIGWYSCVSHGYALPLFGQSVGANTLYIARTAVSGDHRSTIAAFDLIDVDDQRRLRNEDIISLSVGDPWHDVFLWNGVPYIGTPDELWNEISRYHADVASRAPLSILDLALNARRPDVALLAESAMKFLRDHYGDTKARSWRQQWLRGQADIAFRRRLVRANLSQDLSRNLSIEEPVVNILELHVPEGLEAQAQRKSTTEILSEISPLAAFLGATIDTALTAPALDLELPLSVPPLSSAEETSIRSDAPALVIVSGKRAEEIARHLKKCLGSDPSKLEMIIAKSGRLPKSIGGRARPTVAVIVGEEDRRDFLSSEVSSLLRRQSEAGALIIIIPALPLMKPSRLFERADLFETRSGYVVLDTAIARSPLWWGNEKRSIDRRISDVIELALLTARSSVVRRELLHSLTDEGLILSVGSLLFEKSRRTLREPALRLPLVSEASWVPADPKLADKTVKFSLRINSDDIPDLTKSEQVVVEGRRLEKRFSDFAVAVTTSLISRGRSRSTIDSYQIEEMRAAPAGLAKTLQFPEDLSPLRIRRDGGTIKVVVTSETPSLDAVKSADREGWDIARYTDTPTLRRLISGETEQRTFPDEIDIGKIRSTEVNRLLATRGIDLRDVIRISFDDMSEWLDRLPDDERDRAVAHVRPLRTGARPYGDESNDHVLRRDFLAQRSRAATELLDVLQLRSHAISASVPLKRAADLEKCWTRSPDFQRFVLADGIVPGIVLELQAGEIPSQELFVIDGDVSIPLLYRSRVFAVWARATLPKASSWMARFSVTSTFGGFPIPKPFRIIRLDENRTALICDEIPSSVVEAVQKIDRSIDRGLAGLAPENWREAHRAANSSSARSALDAFICEVYRLPEEASDIHILERLLELNAKLN